ncbi:hypothetical protein HF521_022234, partial [Silurus meridionalis]
GEAPNRTQVGMHLLQSEWIQAVDIYSFISLPNKREHELCFFHGQTLESFINVFNTGSANGFWKNWELVTSAAHDIKHLVVKFWTARVADEDVEVYLSRFCEIIQPVQKPVDQFGIWYGVRKYKVKNHQEGELMRIPNTISMGPYNSSINYPGQIQWCFICNSTEHQAKDCDKQKCWKCGSFGHKGKECTDDGTCNLCGGTGHSYFGCPNSYSNRTR